MRFCSLLLALPLLWAGSLFADSHFIINLNSPLGSACGETCSGGWTDGQQFDAFANTGTSTAGFSEFCLAGEEESCEDPDMELDLGCCSTAVNNLHFTFSANSDGGGILDFFNNTGQHWDDLLIITDFNSNDFYTCGTTAFDFCGFQRDQTDSSKLDILFSGGPGIDSVPEPASGLLLVAGLASLVIARRRKVSRP